MHSSEQPNQYSPDVHDRDRLAYGWVSQTLDMDEQAWVESTGLQDANFIKLVDYWENHLDLLDHTSVPAQPSAQVWQGIEENLFAHKTAGKATLITTKHNQPILGARSVWTSLAMAASIALFGLFLLLQPPSVQQVNLQDQWLVQANFKPNTLVIKAKNPLELPPGKVCNLWFKSGNTVIGITELPMAGELVVDLQKYAGLENLLREPGVMMVTIDPYDAGLENMANQAIVKGQWL